MPTQLTSWFKSRFWFNLPLPVFNLIYAVATVILYNGMFFKYVRDYNPSWLFLSCVFIGLTTVFFLAASFLFHGRMAKPLAITFAILNAIIFYFMYVFNAAIDKIMLLNALRSDIYEAGDLFSPKFFGIFLFWGILPMLLILKTQIHPVSRRLQLISCGIAAALLAAVMLIRLPATDAFLRASRGMRYFLAPANYIGAIISVAKIKAKPTPALVKIGEDANITPYWNNQKKNLFVFVMGETARAANFSLGNYQRPTNAPLETHLDEIIYFDNAWSCGTATAVSVPCTFSKDARGKFKPGTEVYTENLLDILKRVNYKVLWRENNTGCQYVCDRIELEDPCRGKNTCLDEVMLNNLQERIKNFEQNAFIVLHQRGSHGPAYSEHYPQDAELWTPVCHQKDFPYCSYDSMVNVYDNSIYYTSRFLAQTIKQLKRLSKEYNTILFYISDHGESLGENGKFLHSAPYDTAPDYQKHIPFLIWMPDNFAQDFNINRNCLLRNKSQYRSQDNIFHSVLGLSGIKTSLYNPELDIFAACRKSSK